MKVSIIILAESLTPGTDNGICECIKQKSGMFLTYEIMALKVLHHLECRRLKAGA